MATQELEHLTYEQTEEGGLGRAGLITWRAAHAEIVAYGRTILLNYENEFGKLGNRGAWAATMKARKVVGLNVARALVRLRINLYTNRREPRGIRRFQTRNWKGTEEKGTKHGKPAYRRPVGRAPISETAWVEAYHKRLVARRKYKSKRDRPTIKIPPTKRKRPHARDPKWIRGVRYLTRGRGRPPLSRRQWLTNYLERLRKKRKGTQKVGVVVPKIKGKRPGPGAPRGSEEEAKRHPVPFEKRRPAIDDAGDVIDYANELKETLIDYALDKAEDVVKQAVEVVADKFLEWIKEDLAGAILDGRGN